MAAQAYSPSDAMSQAKIGLDGMQKVQRLDANFAKAIRALKRGLAANVSVARAGWSSRFSPSSATSPHRPMRRGRLAGRRRSRGPAAQSPAACSRRRRPASTPGVLDKAVASGCGFWTARPAGPAAALARLRGATERREPCAEIGAMLLKHRQDGSGARTSCMCMRLPIACAS